MEIPVIEKLILFVLLVGGVGCAPTPTEIEKMSSSTIFTDKRVAQLVAAAESGDGAEVRRLAKGGVDVNSRGRYEVTPILMVIRAENRQGYGELLALGANPNLLDKNGFSAIAIAAEKQDAFWLREALAHGGDPNLQNKGNPHFPGQTPLFFALWERRPENVRMLLEAGSDVNHVSAKSGRPLDIAMSRTYQLVLMLLEAGADYKRPGFSLLERTKLRLAANIDRAEEQVWLRRTIEFLEAKQPQLPGK